MELKQYQREVLAEVARYARTYALTRDAATAYGIFLQKMGLTPGTDGVSSYHDDHGGVPRVCVKVPTGGGKTFIAACAIDVLSDVLPAHDDVVVWLVPRREILEQTLRNLRSPDHFLRMRLDADFAGRVEVLDKEDGLRGRGFNASTMGNQLTLFVLSYDSFKNKDGRRAFAENSALAGLTEQQRSAGTAVDIENADDTALISALAGSNPIVIVDESHHAKSRLSVDMLRNLNPRFVLELTATPDPRRANVIAQASARALKREEMVKLPVVVYRRADKRVVVQDAVTLQRRLEAIAEQDERRTGRYIRPIVLFQAERRGVEGAETYERLRDALVEGGIPEEQVAVRTGDVDELAGVDLMSRGCPVRFIITVEALAEGWDCPFAYVLATVANKSSQVSVEQIVGRVLRQPYALRAKARSLNIAYVLTASADFDATLQQVVDGLNGSGFSAVDVEAAESAPASAAQGTLFPTDPAAGQEPGDFDDAPSDGSDSVSETVTQRLRTTETGSNTVQDIIDASEKLEQRFENEAGTENAFSRLAEGIGGDVNVYRMRKAIAETATALTVPRFMVRVDGGLFTGDESWKPLDREDLLQDFKLSKYGIDGVHIDATAFSDARAVDLTADSDEYKIRWLDNEARKNMRMLFSNMSDEGRRASLVSVVYDGMTTPFKNTFGEQQLKAYIGRVVDDLDSPMVDACLDSVGTTAHAVMAAVRELADVFCEDRFEKALAAGDVRPEPTYHFPEAFRQVKPLTSFANTLYEAEDGGLDGFERKMVDLLSNSPRILWWHRVVERRAGEFSINGFINHYPDFLALRTDGVLMAIETKGGHLTGDDTKRKLALGTRWADMAGARFTYSMVFDDEAIEAPNAYTMAEFSGEILG